MLVTRLTHHCPLYPPHSSTQSHHPTTPSQVANLVFALPFMPKSQPAGWVNVLSLVVIMAGLVMYRFWPAIGAGLARYGLWKVSPETEEDALLEDSGANGEGEEEAAAGSGLLAAQPAKGGRR